MERGTISGRTYIIMHLTNCQVKKSLTSDLRYDAVGSSSLREELFNTFMKGNFLDVSSSKIGPVPAETTSLSKEERKERAVKEREQKIKAELNRVEMNIERSRKGINHEEGERDYKCAILVSSMVARFVALTYKCVLSY